MELGHQATRGQRQATWLCSVGPGLLQTSSPGPVSLLGTDSGPMRGGGKVQELEKRGKAKERSGRFRDSLSVALVTLTFKKL